jgi:hypothetical protein
MGIKPLRLELLLGLFLCFGMSLSGVEGPELGNFARSLRALLVSLVGSRERTDYFIALDEGLRFPGDEGESCKARYQLAGPVTADLAKALVAHKVVIASTPLVNNLFLITAQDPLRDGRVEWWLRNGNRKPFNSIQEARQDLVKRIQENDDSQAFLENHLTDPIISNEDRSRAQNALKSLKKYIAQNVLPILEHDYEVFLAEGGNFVVLVPTSFRTSNNAALAEAGLLPAKLTPVAFNAMRQVFSRYDHVELSVDQFKALVNPNNAARKNIILGGHGSPKPHFAGLEKPEYQKLLRVFNAMGCVSLVVRSCFTGGDAVAKMHEMGQVGQVTTFDLHDINFLMLMEATAETVIGGYMKVADYYDAIDAFCKTGRQDDLKRAVAALQSTFSDAAIPSIYFPTKYKDLPALFRVVEVDKRIVRLTFARQKKLLLEQKVAREPASGIILNTDNTLLYYPSVIEVPVTIHGAAKLVSMAQGSFTHTFDKITASGLTFYQCISRIIGTIKSSSRAYVIKELICKDKTVRGLVVFVAKNYLGVLWRQGTEYYILQQGYVIEVGNPFPENGIDIHNKGDLVNQATYMTALLWIDRAGPTPEIIRQSSGGQETADMAFDAAMHVVCETAGLDTQKVVFLTQAIQERLLKKQVRSPLVLKNGTILLCPPLQIQVPLVLEGTARLVPLYAGSDPVFRCEFSEITAQNLTLDRCLNKLFGCVMPYVCHYSIRKLICTDQSAQDVDMKVFDKSIEVRLSGRSLVQGHQVVAGGVLPDGIIKEMRRRDLEMMQRALQKALWDFCSSLYALAQPGK